MYISIYIYIVHVCVYVVCGYVCVCVCVCFVACKHVYICACVHRLDLYACMHIDPSLSLSSFTTFMQTHASISSRK